LVAQGHYDDAYLLNRQSNVFPGILGRTCDRPCEPACRRGRVDDTPVAICRIKRVAADLRGDVSERLPKPPTKKNGKRVACIGAGPASLAVANDLAPLGYDVVVFEKNTQAGGLMRTNVPTFRLPKHVLDDEIAMIVNMGVEVRYGSPVASMKALLGQGFDAVFVGSGAPRGKDLELPGRKEAAANIHIGIDWLESVAFGHIERIGQRVLIIGVGNTAMDCCRTSRRIGGKSVKVMARRERQFFKASPWELEDAEEEQVDILVNHVPTRFVVEGTGADARLRGMEFDRVEWLEDAKGKQTSRTIEKVFIPADDVILAIGQENAFPWIERDIGVEFGKWDMPKVDETTFQSTRAGIFFGGDSAFGPKNIIWAVAHAHEAAISIHNHCQGIPLTQRPPRGMNLVTQKMGLFEWSYSNDYNPAKRQKMKHVDLRERFRQLSIEVELGFDPEQTAREVERCLNCDVQTVFTDKRCIECDACIDVCPLQCLTILPNAEEKELRERGTVPALNTAQPLFVSGALPQTGRVMVKDEDVCVHCGLCAERCPTAAWDMQKSDIVIAKAGSTRSNSAPAATD
jgi:NADPH-dependent glutamate synthase beta subunit-like oxidoreductase/formate hydrogenlyase subunit 6/NADH:ubiquinone oxidoreductase subunit I